MYKNFFPKWLFHKQQRLSRASLILILLFAMPFAIETKNKRDTVLIWLEENGENDVDRKT